MNNATWKSKYYEKNNHESHINIFKSLEIENYLKQSLKKGGGNTKFNYKLHNFTLNFSNTRIDIFLSIYEEPKNKTQQTNKNKHKIIKKIGENAFKTVRQLTNDKFHIIFKIKVLNEKRLTKTVEESLLNQKLLKQKYHKFVYRYSERLFDNYILILATKKNSASLLGTFIARQLKRTKRHNFFLNTLMSELNKIISQNYCKVKGIKIRLKGRLNNAPRSQNRIIQTGKLPITSQNVNMDYSETTSFTSNGTIGIKIWINQ